MGNANRIYLQKEEAIERLKQLYFILGESHRIFDSTNPEHREYLETKIHVRNLMELLKFSKVKKAAFFRITPNVIRNRRKDTVYLYLPNPLLTWETFKKLK